MSASPVQPFWKTKTLEDMSLEEWESLCDRCGRCCLVKLEDEDSGEIYFTDIGCRLFDAQSCSCKNYPERQHHVADCIKLTPAEVREIKWLPPTCGYRLIRDGEDLPWWHPLISGSADTVHRAGISVRGKVKGLEDEVPLTEVIDHIVRWPLKVPRMARQDKK